MTAAGQVPRREPRNPRRYPPVWMRCIRCNEDWKCADGYSRQIRRGLYEAICPACKHPTRGTIQVTEALRWWWCARWTPAEIQLVSRMIWGPDLTETGLLGLEMELEAA